MCVAHVSDLVREWPLAAYQKIRLEKREVRFERLVGIGQRRRLNPQKRAHSEISAFRTSAVWLKTTW
jgi:hypothetical protein